MKKDGKEQAYETLMNETGCSADDIKASRSYCPIDDKEVVTLTYLDGAIMDADAKMHSVVYYA